MRHLKGILLLASAVTAVSIFAGCFKFKNLDTATDPFLLTHGNSDSRQPRPTPKPKPNPSGQPNPGDPTPPPLITPPPRPEPTPESSVSRTSGMVTHLRLKTLFPNSPGVLPAKDFGFEGATGLNRAFGLQARPFDSLAQIALRQKIGELCSDTDLNTNSTLFELRAGKQLLEGESAPESESARIAVAAARNAWFHPYTKDDLEVKELIELYQYAENNPGPNENAKERSICMAVLLAPQFWLGAPEATDPARRVSMELFRRIPTLQELKDYADGKITMEAYFNQRLSEEDSQLGFKETLHQWHEEWLGFREFMATSELYHDRRGDLRDGISGTSSLQAVTFADGNKSVGSRPVIVSGRVAGTRASGCLSNETAIFDPTTAMISWEHYNYDFNRFEFVGGFVRTGPGGDFSLQPTITDSPFLGIDQVVAQLTVVKSYLGPLLHPKAGLPPDDILAVKKVMIGDICNKGTSNDPNFNYDDQDNYHWKRCNGLVSLGLESSGNIFITMNQVWDYIDSDQKFLDDFESRLTIECTTGQPDSLVNCLARRRNDYRANRNGYIADFTQLAYRIKSYNTTGVLRSGLSELLTAIINLGGDYNEKFVLPEKLSDIKNRISVLKTDIDQGGWYYETDISEMKNPDGFGNGLRYNLGGFEYYSTQLGAHGSNRKLPLYHVTKLNFQPEHRRVRRLGGINKEWQDGYSPVKLWHTGATVAVCNNADRHWATCFYRPNPGIDGADIAGYNPSLPRLWNKFYSWVPDSYMHPVVASAFSCALPESSALMRFHSVDTPQAFRAFKENPSNYLNIVNNIALNHDVASNIDLQSGGAPAASPTTVIGLELSVFREVYEQLREEPYKLISHLILDKEDYRKLLTADYTYGSGCLELFYNTQGFYLPYAQGALGGLCSRVLDQRFQAGPGIPTGFIANALGGYQGAHTARSLIWSHYYSDRVPDSIPPRVYSGILTMPAFIAPVATKARGIASRYFARLLCDQPNFYDPEKDSRGNKVEIHKKYISNRAHLREECFQCHRNLDPLASSFSWSFISLLPFGGGENSVGDFQGELDNYISKTLSLAGVRHGTGPKGNGAFLGEEVEGIQDLGNKIANSHRFAQCTVETAFANIFGRQVQIADLKIVRNFIEEFKNPEKLNYRYLELIKRMITSDHYRRKN